MDIDRAEVIREIQTKDKPVFVFGDINNDLLKPNTKLEQIVNENKLNQLIDRPTRITKDSSTLLDVLITNRTPMIKQFDVKPSPIADHEIVSASINLRKPKCQPAHKTYRSLKNY